MSAAEASVRLALADDATKGIGVRIAPDGAALFRLFEGRGLINLDLVEHAVFEREFHDAVRPASTRGFHLRNRGTTGENDDRRTKRQFMPHTDPLNPERVAG